MKTWTPEEVEQLKQLYASGMKVQDIATTLGRNMDSIYSKLKNAKLSNKRKGTFAKPQENKKKFSDVAKFYLGYYD